MGIFFWGAGEYIENIFSSSSLSHVLPKNETRSELIRNVTVNRYKVLDVPWKTLRGLIKGLHSHINLVANKVSAPPKKAPNDYPTFG